LGFFTAPSLSTFQPKTSIPLDLSCKAQRA
jgi:hypothetical protein